MTSNRLTLWLHSFVQRRFVRDTALLQSGQFAMIVIQALTNFLLIRVLGVDQLGVYTLIVTLASLVAVLDVSGTGRVTITQLSRAIGAEDVEGIRDALAYYLRISLQFNLPLVILFFLVVPVVGTLLYSDPQIGAWARWLALTELTDIPSQMIGVILLCNGETQTLLIYETIKLVLVSLATVVALLAGYGIPGVIVGTLLVNLIYAAVSIVVYRRMATRNLHLQAWPALLRRMKSVKIGPNFRMGFLIAIDKNLDSLLDKVVILFLGTLGKSFMGNYAIALKIVTLPQPLVSGIARSLDTFVPRRAGAQPEGMRDTFTRVTLFSGALWSLVTLAIGIGGPILLILFFPAYVAGIPFIFPLLFQSMAVGLGVGIGSTLRTIGKLNYPIVVRIVTLLLFVPVGVLVVSRFGQYGAVWWAGLVDLLLTTVLVGLVWWVLRTTEKKKH